MKLTYTNSSDRFFDDLTTMLFTIASHSFATNSHARNSAHLFSSNNLIWLQGLPNLSNVEIGFYPLPIVMGYAQNTVPNAITLLKAPLGTNTTVNTITVNTLIGPTERIIAGIFTCFFERHLPQVKLNHGPSCQTWPSVWDFARVVRNAFSHGGVIHFENPTAQPVSWQGITLSPANNGVQIFYNFISFPEIISLLEQLDQTL